jgi:hypothetical protein
MTKFEVVNSRSTSAAFCYLPSAFWFKRATFCLLLCVFCFLPSAPFCRGSQSRGSGSSIVCGWMPHLCAPTDRVPRPNLSVLRSNVDGSWTDNGPQINMPWVNEFGEREVRATDGNVPGGYPDGDGWRGPGDWWTNYWSVFDPSIGGYYFYLTLDGGSNRLFILNSASMQVTPVCSNWPGCAMPYASEFSYVTPGLMYYPNGSAVYKYNYDTNAGPTEVYDFANCPGLMTNQSGGTTIVGDTLVSTTDQVIGARIGNSIFALYNTSTAKCYWFSTVYGLVGGTDNPAPVASGLPWPGPPSLGTLGTTPSGNLPAGTYYVRETVRSDLNYSPSETLPSSEGTVALSAGGSITIGPPTIASNPIWSFIGKYCMVYIGASSGSETLQMSNQSCSSTLTFPGPLASGTASPPTQNAAGFWLHGVNMNLSGQWASLGPDQVTGSSANLMWQTFNGTGTETPSMTFCNLYGGCGGHTALGYAQMFYVISEPNSGGVPAHYDFGMGGFSNIGNSSAGNITRLHPSGPPFFNPYSPNGECNVTDTHATWLYDNGSDSMPIVVSSFVDGSDAYSLPIIKCAWDHEIDAVASDGSGTTWRLAHNRASGLANPQSQDDSQYNALSMPVCSPDGRYCLWTTDWNSGLGTQTENTTIGGASCYSMGCAWIANASYSTHQEIIDSNGNEEVVTSAGASGNNPPNWPTTANATVTDGSVNWQMQPGCDTSATQSVSMGGNPQGKGECRTDVFIVEAK